MSGEKEKIERSPAEKKDIWTTRLVIAAVFLVSAVGLYYLVSAGLGMLAGGIGVVAFIKGVASGA